MIVIASSPDEIPSILSTVGIPKGNTFDELVKYITNEMTYKPKMATHSSIKLSMNGIELIIKF